VRQRLEQVAQNKKFRTYTDELMRNAKIEKLLDKPAAGQAPGAPATEPKPAAAAAPPAAAPPPAASPAPKG